MVLMPHYTAHEEVSVSRFKAVTFRKDAFVSGLATGLAAPAFLLTGFFETPLPTRRASVEGSWMRAGQHLRTAMSDYGITVERSRRFR